MAQIGVSQIGGPVPAPVADGPAAGTLLANDQAAAGGTASAAPWKRPKFEALYAAALEKLAAAPRDLFAAGAPRSSRRSAKAGSATAFCSRPSGPSPTATRTGSSG